MSGLKCGAGSRWRRALCGVLSGTKHAHADLKHIRKVLDMLARGDPEPCNKLLRWMGERGYEILSAFTCDDPANLYGAPRQISFIFVGFARKLCVVDIWLTEPKYTLKFAGARDFGARSWEYAYTDTPHMQQTHVWTDDINKKHSRAFEALLHMMVDLWSLGGCRPL